VPQDGGHRTSSGYLNLKIPLEASRKLGISNGNVLISKVGSVTTCFVTDVLVTGVVGDGDTSGVTRMYFYTIIPGVLGW